MKRCGLVVLCVLLVFGCVPNDNALLPTLKGRWVSETSARTRLALASTNSSVSLVLPSTKELCQTEYITFDRLRPGSEFSGGVVLHRHGKRDFAFLVATAEHAGNRIVLTGQEPNHPIAGDGRTRIELVLRNGELAFEDVIDQRGRSVRFDRFKFDDPARAQRVGLNTIGDLFRVMFDLKPCGA